jgi:hypothetical protein
MQTPCRKNAHNRHQGPAMSRIAYLTGVFAGVIRWRCLLAAAIALLPWSAALAQTQVGVPGKGHGALTLSYQDNFVYYSTIYNGDRFAIGTITHHTMLVNLDYGLTDKLSINVGLPYMAIRYSGPDPHDPSTLQNPHGQHIIDDRHYHSGWQDWGLGLRYQWLDKPLIVTPFVTFNSPSHDYVTFAHSALGTHQNRLQLGVSVARRFGPPFENLFVEASYGYSIMAKIDNRRVNHSSLSVDLGYFVTPRLSADLLVFGQKTHNGLDFPFDYPSQTDEHFFHHDDTFRTDFIGVSAGVNYQLTPRYGFFANYGRMLRGENTHLVKYAITVGISRSF